MNDRLPTSVDAVVPFLFENLPVRGALIQLKTSWARMQLGQEYNNTVTTMLGQSAAATGLIAQSLKFDGTISLQLSGDGPLSMLIMQSTDELELRGMASAPLVSDGMSYPDLTRNCRCAITVETDGMEQPYQGIVEMLGESLGDSIENYFTRSAQIPSHMILVADRSVSGGILLQQMPEREDPVEDDWRRLKILAQTLQPNDFSEGVGPKLIGKLFIEDDIRVFEARPAAFRCRCSRERAEEILQMLGEQDTREACEVHGKVDVSCEFCGQIQTFDAVDVSHIFAEQPLQESDRLH